MSMWCAITWTPKAAAHAIFNCVSMQKTTHHPSWKLRTSTQADIMANLTARALESQANVYLF